MMSKAYTVMLVALILLLQFFVRAHNPTEQALFIDEERHIERAHSISDGHHPAEESRGKLLLYVWLAPFRSDWDVALHVNRQAVALFSLLGSAGLFLLIRSLLRDRTMAVLGVLIYAFLPFGLFYERMVLADGIAAGIMVYAVWAAYQLARRPTYKMAYIFGALAALAMMAKLTTTFSLMAMPMAAGLLFGPVPLRRLDRETVQQLYDFWLPYALRVTGMVVFLWAFVLIPAAIAWLMGDGYYLVVTSLLGGVGEPVNNFPANVIKMVHPLAWAFIIGGVLLGWRLMPRRYAFVLIWLVMSVGPLLTIIARKETPTRYLMIAASPTALLFVMALYVLWKGDFGLKLPLRLRGGAVGAVLAAWLAFFALPFAAQASTAPEDLPLPQIDAWHYFQSPMNAYAYLDAFDWLRAHGEADENGRYQVITFGWMCDKVLIPYGIEDMALQCIEYWHDPAEDGHFSPAHSGHQATLRAAIETPAPVYLVIDTLYDFPENPFPTCDIEWVLLERIAHPRNGNDLGIWDIVIAPGSDGLCEQAIFG